MKLSSLTIYDHLMDVIANNYSFVTHSVQIISFQAFRYTWQWSSSKVQRPLSSVTELKPNSFSIM